MGGNTFGRFFRVTTFGESHGTAVGCVLDGFPAGIVIDELFIQAELQKRRPGQNPYVTPRNEADKLHILSGVFEGKSLGTPICCIVYNQDHRSNDYQALRTLYRPGHGDYTFEKKYGHRDWRGGGRSSARETVARVIAGAFAKLFLSQKKIFIHGCLRSIGPLKIPVVLMNRARSDNPFFCAHHKSVNKIERLLETLKAKGDSVGACIDVTINGLPSGLGQPVFDKLEAELSKAILSIPAIKGIEFGYGFKAAVIPGSRFRDAISARGFCSNRSGGTLAGISTGQPLYLSLAVKPTSSIRAPINTINQQGDEVSLSVEGRHDPCVGIRAVPIVEAMAACVIMDHILLRFGESHSHMRDEEMAWN